MKASHGRSASIAGIAASSVVAVLSALLPAAAGAAEFQLGTRHSLDNAMGRFEDRGEFSKGAVAGEVLELHGANAATHADASAKVLLDGWVRADPGRLSGSLTAWTATDVPTRDETRASSTGGLEGSSTDRFVIACDRCEAGTRGTLHFRILLDGYTNRQRDASVPPVEFGGYASSATSWRTSADLDAGLSVGSGGRASVAFFRNETLRSDNRSFIEQSEDVSPGYQDLSIPFTFGTPISVGLSMSASVFTEVYGGKGAPPFRGHAGATTDLSRGIAWAGITSVLDAQGRLMGGITAFNDQGIDYARSFASAVPEPGTWASMTGGLIVLAALSRRRRGAVQT